MLYNLKILFIYKLDLILFFGGNKLGMVDIMLVFFVMWFFVLSYYRGFVILEMRDYESFYRWMKVCKE